MDRRLVAAEFRSRVLRAMERADLTKTALAEQAGIDRSTLTQMLSGDFDRMPRADTAAAIAVALQVSLDWLLGLTQDARVSADILLESLEFRPSAGVPVEEDLKRWHEDAKGYKIRYVPTSLPDLAKTDAVLKYEYKDFVAKSADRAISDSQHKLAYSRQPDTDMEICMSTQAIEIFAAGAGRWADLPLDDRLDQLKVLADLTDELYPTLRLFLFDGMTHYSAPYTVFGPLRASVYIGQAYLVFNTTEHIRALASHFDSLIRAAVVQASDVSDYLRRRHLEISSRLRRRA